jgi:hypothetical protein
VRKIGVITGSKRKRHSLIVSASLLSFAHVCVTMVVREGVNCGGNLRHEECAVIRARHEPIHFAAAKIGRRTIRYGHP